MNDTAIVFLTCDEYEAVWPGFAKLFLKYYSNNKFPIYTTASKDYKLDNLYMKSIPNKLDNSPCSRLINVLKHIKEKYVIVFLDDYYLIDYVDDEYINESLNLLRKNRDIGYIVLQEWVSHKERCTKRFNKDYFIMDKKVPYRTILQVCLWKKSYFLKILRKGENYWQFEINGTIRSRYVRKKILFRDDENNNRIPYTESGIIQKGKITKEGSKILKKYNIFLEQSQLKVANKVTKNNLLICFYRKFIYPKLSLFFHVKYL